MISRIPIYQMTYGKNNEGEFGLMFSSEQGDNGSQSVVFAIPILESFKHPFRFIESIEHVSVYFPFEMEGVYYELEAKIEFPELFFQVPNTDIVITFSFDLENTFNWSILPFIRRKEMNYIGKDEGLILPNIGFLTLMPIDLQEMDSLYLKYRAIFVGLTPNFGELDKT